MVVDAKLIGGTSSTRNADGERDPDMKQSKNGNLWYLGMMVHIGADADSGLVLALRGTACSDNDVAEANALRYRDDDIIFGNAGYQGVVMRADAKPQVRWNITTRTDKSREPSRLIDELERLKTRIRAQG
jgi:IS5 family transposase